MNQSIVDRLILLREKGACYHSQRKVFRVFESLYQELTEHDIDRLSIAHSHWKNGEGAEEFDDVCKQLIQKYKG